MPLRGNQSPQAVRDGVRYRFLNAILPRRALREGSWVLLGQGLSALGVLFSVRLITELLSPEEFGRLTLLVGISALALGLAASPPLQAVMRFYADWSRKGAVATLRTVSLRMIAPVVAGVALVIVLAWLAAGPVVGDLRVTGLLIAALVIVDSVRSFEIVLLNSARRQRPTALIYAADAWSRPVMAFASVMAFGASANAALLGYVAGSGLVVIAVRFLVQREGAPATGVSQSAVDPSQARLLRAALWRYALPLLPLALFGWISGLGDRYLIGGMLGLDQAGLYAAAYGLVSKPFLMSAGIVELVFRPVFYTAIASGDLARIRRLKHAWLMTTGLLAAAGLAAFAIFGDEVARLLLAESYRSVSNLFPLIALGYAIYTFSNVFSRFCYAFNDTRAVLVLTVAGAVVAVLVAVPAVAVYALVGAAAAVPIHFSIELALSAVLARRAETSFRASPTPTI